MANHDLLLDILERYGAPPKFVAAIEKCYQNLIVVLKIEKEVVELPQTVGVRQGDNMAPVLFLFLMSAFAETLETEWKTAEIDVCTVQPITGPDSLQAKERSEAISQRNTYQTSSPLSRSSSVYMWTMEPSFFPPEKT
jgi:hypothetical protein